MYLATAENRGQMSWFQRFGVYDQVLVTLMELSHTWQGKNGDLELHNYYD